MKTVWIQQRHGEWANMNCAASAHGFRLKGYDVRGFEREELAGLTLDREETIVHGEISAVKAALRQIGVTPPAPLHLPNNLHSFLGRAQWEATLGDVRALVMSESPRLPIFIKPRDEQKLFTGQTVRVFRDLLATSALPDELHLLVQEMVEFQAEWRVFVLHGQALNASFYRGKPLRFPDSDVIHAFLAGYDTAPVAYSADFGVTDAGTLLVECNDAFALGCYGLPALEYAAMIEARWSEMCRANVNATK